jgi:hypothetical protein
MRSKQAVQIPVFRRGVDEIYISIEWHTLGYILLKT